MSERALSSRRPGEISLDPGRLAGISGRELVFLQTGEVWYRLDAKSRLYVLQEAENRLARQAGRTPAYIYPTALPLDRLGAYSPSGNKTGIIFINEKFLTACRPDRGYELFGPAVAFRVILHEGRHAFQHDKVRQGSLSRRQILEWAMNDPALGGHYFGGDISLVGQLLGEMQNVEVDARRFARRKLEDILTFFRANGIRDPGYERESDRCRAEEYRLISLVRRLLSPEILSRIEKSLIERFARLHPDLDVRSLTLFDSARLILEHPEINDPERLLCLMDRHAEGKMYLLADKSLKLKGKPSDQLSRIPA